MSDDFTDWLSHDGKGCPLCIGQVAEIFHEAADGSTLQYVLTCSAKTKAHPAWVAANFRKIIRLNGCRGRVGRVVRYRLKRPRALINLIEMIDTLPERQKEEACPALTP